MTEFMNYGKIVPFSAKVVPNDYDCACDMVSYCYPGAIQGAWVPGVSVKISPASGEEWLGYFMAGKESPNAIDFCCIHPNGKRLIVIAKGTGYVVDPKDPALWEEIPLRPILGYHFDEELNILVLFDYTRVIGIGEKGYIWKTPSLSWDGLADVEIKEGVLIGKGWDAVASKFVKFEIHLIDGSHIGGASPPSDR